MADNNRLLVIIAAIFFIAFMLHPELGITSKVIEVIGSFNITNFPPVLEPIANITVNETDLVSIVPNATDPNGDNITFYFTSPLNSTGQWQTTLQDSGVYVTTVTASDGYLNDSQDVTITVLEVADIDNDGIPDTIDTLLGFSPDVITNTTTMNITVNGSLNLSQLFLGPLLTQFRDNGEMLIEFVWNYSHPDCVLVLYNLTIDKQGPNSTFGSILIKGINASCIVGNKTMYVDEIDNSTDKVCIKDTEIESIANISDACNESYEALVPCDGNNYSGYRCTEIDDIYNVTGIKHSGVKEYICIENWACTSWGACIGGWQTRTCTDLNNCGTVFNKPAEARTCEEPAPAPPPCTPSWTCTDWMPVVCPPDETQTRTCTDENECGTDEGKPDETRSCVYTPTCDDGIQNQDEEGIDCGGPCPPCPTCDDGIQNQGEEGIDCGGPCPACPTCDDGIQNQGEEDIDCGGPCPACPTCEDGIQNQDEEGVDCGGPCPPCVECVTDADCGIDQECKNGVCVAKIPIEVVEEKPTEIEEIKTKNTVSCEELPIVEEVERVELEEYRIVTKENITIELPEGYVIIVPPFKVDCVKGQSTRLHIAVPDNFVDIQALRCVGGVCGIAAVKNITTASCADRGIVSREVKTLKIEAMPTKIGSARQVLTKENLTIKSGNYSVQFLTPLEKTRAAIGMPRTDQPQPKNKNARIAGTPVVIRITSEQELTTIPAIVTMPYVADKAEEQSIAIYAKVIVEDGTTWEYIGGKVDTTSKTITAEIDLKKYLLDGELILVPIAIYCPYCYDTLFENPFTPEPDSRNAILLVHGLFSTPTTWQAFIEDIALTNQPYQLWTFGYPSWKSPIDNARDLANFLEDYKYRYDNIYIIGHSLGGLVTQQMLYHAYTVNKKNASQFTFINSVRKVVLVGTPSEGTPFIKYFKPLVDDFVNKETEEFYSLHSAGYEFLSKGLIVPKVPGIEYYVIAGTQSYTFLDITTLYFDGEVNDGLVSLSSAQRVGEAYLKAECEDFWSRAVMHTALNDDPIVRKIVEQLIAKSAKEELRKQLSKQALLGYSSYFELNIDYCLPEDLYVIIGKEIKESEVINPVICGCGNGICAGAESVANCPQDCIIVPKPIWPTIIVLLMVALIFTICEMLRKRKKEVVKEEKKLKKEMIKEEKKFKRFLRKLRKPVIKPKKKKKIRKVKKKKKALKSLHKPRL